VLGEDVLITGAGPIGLMAAAIVRHAGARHVVVTDINSHRLDLARSMGVTSAIDTSRTTLEDVQRDLGMTEGFDIGLEMSGHPLALDGMLANMSHGGRIALLGLYSEPTTIDWNRVITSMLTIKGIYGREMYETWYSMSVMLQSGLDISPVITHRFAAADFHEAFATARSGQAGKVIMDWTQW
jgi:threonine 3-dehydrogenase